MEQQLMLKCAHNYSSEEEEREKGQNKDLMK
jgi:hypothetical protein